MAGQRAQGHLLGNHPELEGDGSASLGLGYPRRRVVRMGLAKLVVGPRAGDEDATVTKDPVESGQPDVHVQRGE